MQTACSCAKTRVEVDGSPVLRFICHCKICQKVYREPFADIIALKASQVVTPDKQAIEFRRHRLPPSVSRGVCSSCRKPVLALMPLVPSFFGIAFVPAANYSDKADLPKPLLHTFYDRRVIDVEDGVDKFNGYWESQWALAARFISHMSSA